MNRKNLLESRLSLTVTLTFIGFVFGMSRHVSSSPVANMSVTLTVCDREHTFTQIFLLQYTVTWVGRTGPFECQGRFPCLRRLTRTYDIFLTTTPRTSTNPSIGTVTYHCRPFMKMITFFYKCIESRCTYPPNNFFGVNTYGVYTKVF